MEQILLLPLLSAGLMVGPWASESGSAVNLDLPHPRQDFSVTQIAQKKYLLSGEHFDYDAHKSIAESLVFDISTETWIQSGKLKFPRSGNTTTLLNDGRVLVTGGYGILPSGSLDTLS